MWFRMFILGKKVELHNMDIDLSKSTWSYFVTSLKNLRVNLTIYYSF